MAQGSGTLEEVFVTAQKRVENLQDVPISIQSLGSEALEELNLKDFKQYVTMLPTVTMTPSLGAGSGFNLVYMRGIAGVSADTDRDNGVKRALAEFPDINIVHEVFTGWQQDQGKQQMFDFLATGIPFDGVWTSGIDNVIVDAFVESGAPLVPIVGADNAGFVQYLSETEGLEGAAVTNPGSVGGAGVALAVDILNGEAPDSKTVLVDPVLWENATDAGRATIMAAQNPDLDPEWPVSVTIPGWTDYTMAQIIACEGPGEG